MNRKVLLVGPINDKGHGGRFEEMKVWAGFLEQESFQVSVFSMFNTQFAVGNAAMYESGQLIFPKIWNSLPVLRKPILRIWGSKIFRKQREKFYDSETWNRFANSYSHIILFITHKSRELKIFESTIAVPVSIRFTGTIHDFSPLFKHANLPPDFQRNYVIHSKVLFDKFDNGIPTKYIDQTTFAEQSLLALPIDSNLKVFGMIGLFMEVKRMEEIIALFTKLPHFDLVLFGTGDLEASYQRLIEDFDLKNVRIAGFIPPNQISDLYSKIDGLIINSSEETGPMTGVEAMAAGKIIFSRPIGAMSERLENLDMIFESPDALVEKIIRYAKLSALQIHNIKSELRSKYLKKYSNIKLKKQVKLLVDQPNLK